MLELLDAPAEATGWSAAINTSTWETKSALAAAKVQGMQDADEAKPSNLKSELESYDL